jgi:hypothetical protein
VSELRIDFQLEPAGWASVVFSKGDARYKCDGVSDICHPLDALMLVAIDVACNQYASQLSFDGEPTEWRVVFESNSQTPEAAFLTMTIFECRDYSGPYQPMIDGRQVFSCQLNSDEFSVAVQRMADEFLADYGAAGYREIWGSGAVFPFRAFAALSAALSASNDTAGGDFGASLATDKTIS